MRDPRAPGRAPAPACLRHFRTCSPYLEPVLPLGWQGGRGLRAPHFHPGRWFEAWLRPGARSTFAGSWSWLGGRAGGTLLLEHGCWSTLFSCPHQLTTEVPAPPSDPKPCYSAVTPESVGPSGADMFPALRVSLSQWKPRAPPPPTPR